MVGEGNPRPTAAVREARRRYADRAMEALRQAVGEGWENLTWMRSDPDLDALRGRDDFQKLLAGLADKKTR